MKTDDQAEPTALIVGFTPIRVLGQTSVPS
jgi:hypothetical protein